MHINLYYGDRGKKYVEIKLTIDVIAAITLVKKYYLGPCNNIDDLI